MADSLTEVIADEWPNQDNPKTRVHWLKKAAEKLRLA
jgi:hypothetical protein